MRVGFIVDHPKRDLDGIVRIAYALSSRNVSTVLIPLYDQGVDVPLLRLDAIVINYARQINLDLVLGYFNQGIPIFVLDTEGGVLSQEGSNSIKGLTDYISHSPYRQIINGYFFWGNLLRDAFLDTGIFSENQLYLTGCPRFDFASPRWRNTLKYSSEKYILVNANFPLVNPAFAKNASLESKVLIGGGWEKGYVDSMVKDQQEILINFLDTICELATRFPDKTFLIRPHPFEEEGIYHLRFSHLNNVVVDASGNVLNVIKHCACLLHLNCGTSIEAVMLHRLPISMEFLNTPHMAKHSLLPSQISLKSESIEHLVEILEHLSDKEGEFDFNYIYNKFIHGFFFENDGAAGDRVANVLLMTLSVRKQAGLWVSLLWSLRSSRITSTFGQKFQAVLSNLIGTKNTSLLRAKVQSARQNKVISVSRVQDTMSLLTQHEGNSAISVCYARHPISGFQLSSIVILPAEAHNEN